MLLKWAGTLVAYVLALMIRRGRATNSPPQLGQIWCISSAQAGQKVHSCEQIKAGSSGAVAALHFSHPDFISSAILLV